MISAPSTETVGLGVLARAGDEAACAESEPEFLRGDPLGALGSGPGVDLPNLWGTVRSGEGGARAGKSASFMVEASGLRSEW